VLSDLSDAASLALLRPGPVSWQRSHISSYAVFDPSDIGGMVAAARSLVHSLDVQAVVSYDETMLELASELGHCLGLASVPRASAAVV
jgi:hypothetical protein